VAVLGLAQLIDARNERRARSACSSRRLGVGRALGLHDCDDRRCALHPPETPESLDGRQDSLCVNCRSCRDPAAAVAVAPDDDDDAAP
jgi:hypothetical protein